MPLSTNWDENTSIIESTNSDAHESWESPVDTSEDVADILIRPEKLEELRQKIRWGIRANREKYFPSWITWDGRHPNPPVPTWWAKWFWDPQPMNPRDWNIYSFISSKRLVGQIEWVQSMSYKAQYMYRYSQMSGFRLIGEFEQNWFEVTVDLSIGAKITFQWSKIIINHGDSKTVIGRDDSDISEENFKLLEIATSAVWRHW